MTDLMQQAEHEVHARLTHTGLSAQKVRLVCDAVRGRQADAALDMLKFMPQAAARPVFRLIRSAIANAEQNFGMNREDLWVRAIYADEAPTAKRGRFAAKGRWKPILKRSSHITVILHERVSEETAE
jgi:large subunit ribosomal protein L22